MFGLLGAVLSFSTVHFALPLPVWVAVQPGGGAPVFMSSKVTVSAVASGAANVATTVMTRQAFINSYLICALWQRRSDFEQPTNHKPAFDSLGQVSGSAPAPIMEEHDPRLFMRHVLVYSND